MRKLNSQAEHFKIEHKPLHQEHILFSWPLKTKPSLDTNSHVHFQTAPKLGLGIFFHLKKFNIFQVKAFFSWPLKTKPSLDTNLTRPPSIAPNPSLGIFMHPKNSAYFRTQPSEVQDLFLLLLYYICKKNHCD